MTKKQRQAEAAKRVMYAMGIATAIYPHHSAASKRRVNAARMFLKFSTGELRSLWIGALPLLKEM